MKFIICLITLLICEHDVSGLYPRESETREAKLLDGVWNFRTIPLGIDQNIGFKKQWFKQPLSLTGEVIPMPVPSSFNDITQSREIRDYAGWVWYDKEFYVPSTWANNDLTIILRFSSAHYDTVVYVNGINVVNHTGGHLPFQAKINKHLNYNKVNLITVAINNTLTQTTIPQGKVTYESTKKNYPKNFYETSTNFDFFNYAGIHRSVHLYAVPNTHFDDFTIVTDINGTTGIIYYNFSINFPDNSKIELNQNSLLHTVQVYDKEKNLIKQVKRGLSQTKPGFWEIIIPNATLWWPYLMHENPGYQYTLRFSINDNVSTNHEQDVYYLKVGIRTVNKTQKSVLINGRKFYFRGFGKHEDANIRGKGLDFPLIIKDFNLIKWIGANSFRTSHYPYSEELMDQADEQGIVVIDECPAVGLSAFNNVLLKQHKQTITEMINRDKNRPSVMMWSVANEPASDHKEAEEYFKQIVEHTRQLDNTRLVTFACNKDYSTDKAVQFMDVLMINRYNGWYQDTGYLQTIYGLLTVNLENWFKTHKKPIMISEYGGDTVAGLHMDPAYVFSEDYQTELLMNFHKSFDHVISEGFFTGELIWNFADFMTEESTTRVIGNKKGIFTRERQPKAAARLLRCRYWHLAGKLQQAAQSDINLYCPPFLFNQTNLISK